MTKTSKLLGLLAGVLVVSFSLIGCSGDDNRTPSADEIKKADTNRQNFIDNLNIPEDQKAQMKSHMGGPAAPNPADAARNGGTDQAGRRR